MANMFKNDTTKVVIVALLVINVLLGIYIAFVKPGAYNLEVLKAGWRENMSMAAQLYTSNEYIQQQASTLEQLLGSMDQVQLPVVE